MQEVSSANPPPFSLSLATTKETQHAKRHLHDYRQSHQSDL
jgi:hypothetical protein